MLDDNRVRQTVKRVLELRPRGYLGVLGHFQRLVKLDLERRTARIESATPLSPELKSKVQTGLDRLYGPGLIVSFTQNASLLGGLRIKVGSDVYDGSIQGRLAALEASL